MDNPESLELHILQIADDQAKKLGLSMEEFGRVVKKENGFYIVEYMPRDPSRRGGGIEIWVDSKTLRVVRKIYTQ